MYKDIKPQNQLRFYSLDITSLCAGLLLLGTLLFCSQSVMAADDDYLRALEIEAEKSALVSKKPKTKNKRAQTPDQKEFKKFEQAMQTRRPAIYRFYKKLNTDDKTIIFSIYQEDHKFTRASKVVFDLYFDKNK